jgi:hypothetical protein
VRGTLDYLQGLKMLGVKRTERVLPTGTSLTVVGEVIHSFNSSAMPCVGALFSFTWLSLAFVFDSYVV